MTAHDWLTHLLADLAVAPVDNPVRHQLIADTLAPLGVEAVRHAHAIESHAHWVRRPDHVARFDHMLAQAIDVAAYCTELAVTR